jgi:hypothetical protein
MAAIFKSLEQARRAIDSGGTRSHTNQVLAEENTKILQAQQDHNNKQEQDKRQRRRLTFAWFKFGRQPEYPHGIGGSVQQFVVSEVSLSTWTRMHNKSVSGVSSCVMHPLRVYHRFGTDVILAQSRGDQEDASLSPTLPTFRRQAQRASIPERRALSRGCFGSKPSR